MDWKIRSKSNLFAALNALIRAEANRFCCCFHWLTLKVDDEIHWKWTWLEPEAQAKLKLNESNEVYQRYDDYVDCWMIFSSVGKWMKLQISLGFLCENILKRQSKKEKHETTLIRLSVWSGDLFVCIQYLNDWSNVNEIFLIWFIAAK